MPWSDWSRPYMLYNCPPGPQHPANGYSSLPWNCAADWLPTGDWCAYQWPKCSQLHKKTFEADIQYTDQLKQGNTVQPDLSLPGILTVVPLASCTFHKWVVLSCIHMWPTCKGVDMVEEAWTALHQVQHHGTRPIRMWVQYSGPCDLRPLYLTIPCILRHSDTTCIFSV